ncbi:serine/threonine-protein kinase [Thalassoglobus polymorphus]|uniref:Serine/threonine-protein kinase PknB n=1 Tax=Thalassoglobus polymorphus TaxID=2527994 RepID=A0A517QSH8_9PLAN|nr:serine/threonine-protein kinase [Thalassoglobus polymorphus]QDT34547.1 Serine/threonine-protein kinase PknB [Thalassoglobus polymorphus]
MPSLCCLSEEALWNCVTTSAEGEVGENYDHLEDCVDCRSRFERLRGSIDEIYQLVDLDQFVERENNFDKRTDEAFSFFVEAECHAEHECEAVQSPLLAGQVLISKYRVVRLLNSGGQGHVYLAQDFQLNRKVAIKVARFSIDENIVSADTVISEGELLAKVNHPRVAQIYDCGVHAGRPYLVMEYVEGCTLKDYLRDHPLSSRQIHKMILDVAVAVKTIHAHGILHLDIKPENIMVTKDDRCKLIDLGAAWFQPRSSANSEKIIGGTLAYMAPEQVTRTVSAISERTDVFGLGAVLFAFLYGFPPGVDRESSEPSDAIGLGSPPGNLAFKVDKDLKRICLKAIRSDPRHRYSSAAAFLQALVLLANRRKAPYLVSAGLICCLTGVLSQVYSSGAFSSLESQTLSSQVAVSPVSSSDRTNAKYVKVSVRDAPNESVQFCLWSERTGVRFFPAFRVAGGGRKEHQLKGSLHGVELHPSNELFAVLAVDSQYQGGRGDAAFSFDLSRKLKKISTQENQWDRSGVILTEGDVSTGHQIRPISHRTLLTNSPLISGVIVHALEQPRTSMHYDIQLSFNTRDPAICKIRSQ